MSVNAPSRARTAPDYMVSIVTVVANDAVALPSFIAEVHAVLSEWYNYFELLLVDNNSSDRCPEILREQLNTLPGLRWLRLSRAHPEEVAWTAALDHCIGDYVVLMNIYHDSPAMIPVLVKAAARDNAIAVANPTVPPPSWAQRILRRLFFGLANRILDRPINPNVSHFRAYPRQAVNALTKIKHRRRSLHYLSALVGFKQVHLPNVTFRRDGARPPRRLLASLRMGVDLVISNSLVPLRLVARFGLAVSLINLFYLAYIVVVALAKEHLAEGWFTQSVMNTSMFFCLFLVLAILAEYVGRILEEVQDRPLYFLELEMDSQVSRLQSDDLLNVV